ncbi:MAG: hypothetical protein U1F43_19320 [Myxococcota bacterium]
MKTFIASLIISTVSLGGVAMAKPTPNTSAKKHPNLHSAQVLIEKAYKKVEAAQKANEFDLGGHAQKAKELLDQANAELKAAAEVSNENKGN